MKIKWFWRRFYQLSCKSRRGGGIHVRSITTDISKPNIASFRQNNSCAGFLWKTKMTLIPWESWPGDTLGHFYFKLISMQPSTKLSYSSNCPSPYLSNLSILSLSGWLFQLCRPLSLAFISAPFSNFSDLLHPLIFFCLLSHLTNPYQISLTWARLYSSFLSIKPSPRWCGKWMLAFASLFGRVCRLACWVVTGCCRTE